MLDAAESVMRERGLARTTTKEIAKAAGYSEATLYKHFTGKEDLFLHVLHERLPQFIDALTEMGDRVGTGTISTHLTELARQALHFFARSMPIGWSLFSEPGLLAKQREVLRARDAGPHKANQMLASYLRSEQRLGRVAKGVYPEAVASMLLGACFQQAFLLAFMGDEITDPEAAAFASGLVRTLLRGVAP